MVHLMRLSVQMKQDENINEPPAEEQTHQETLCGHLSADYTCNLTIPIPPTNVDVCEENSWDL